jgi:hypothetical protein
VRRVALRALSTDEFHLCYTSQLAPGCDHTVFGAVCRTSRARNAQRGIAGVLLFDGHRFCQWLYGAKDDVVKLMSEIALDARHTDIAMRLETRLPALLFEPQWHAGFIDADALDTFLALEARSEEDTLRAIAHLVGQADLEPPLLVIALHARRSRPDPDAA